MAPLKPADALVLFGATGDLAHKQIWPALHAMAKRGALTVPVVGIAYSQWDRDKALDYARTAVEAAGASIEDDAWKRIEHDFQYVDGDYRDPETFRALAKALGDARSPMHYLAIPPSLFATVVQSLGAADYSTVFRAVTGMEREGVISASTWVTEKSTTRWRRTTTSTSAAILAAAWSRSLGASWRTPSARSRRAPGSS